MRILACNINITFNGQDIDAMYVAPGLIYHSGCHTTVYVILKNISQDRTKQCVQGDTIQ
jgi:hypothetical protein